VAQAVWIRSPLNAEFWKNIAVVYVQDCRNTEKPCQSPDYSLAIGFLENQGLLQAPFSKIDANRDQCQSREEDDWKNPEDNDPDIGIIDVSPDLMRKYEQK